MDNQEDIELTNEAPTLFSIEKRNNFNIPQDYFKTLTQHLSIKTKDVNMNVPDGYFENFSGRLMSKIETSPEMKKTKKSKIIPLISIATIAASIALVVTIGQKSSPVSEDDFTGNDLLLSCLSEEVDFEEELDFYDYEVLENENIDLDFSASEIEEGLSSDFYLNVEF